MHLQPGHIEIELVVGPFDGERLLVACSLSAVRLPLEERRPATITFGSTVIHGMGARVVEYAPTGRASADGVPLWGPR